MKVSLTKEDCMLILEYEFKKKTTSVVVLKDLKMQTLNISSDHFRFLVYL
jgi:hypothetical protein